MCWGGRVLSWWFRSDMFRFPGKMLALAVQVSQSVTKLLLLILG